MSHRLTMLALGALLLPAIPARAHCDTMSGPVVKTAMVALDTRDLRPLLKWVKPEAERELRDAFERTLRVRTQGADARDLATRYFLETAVRLHRAGEGEPYTGLKMEPHDPGGLIAEADRALDSTGPDHLLALLVEQLGSGVRERYAHAVAAGKHADDSLEAGRAFVAAYVEYIHYVETLQQAGADHERASDSGR